jgi:hypothetical protein
MFRIDSKLVDSKLINFIPLAELASENNPTTDGKDSPSLTRSLEMSIPVTARIFFLNLSFTLSSTVNYSVRME